MINNNGLVILCGGKVALISKANGEVIWEVKLKEYVSSSFAYAMGQIVVEEDKIYLGISGYMLCLALKDGGLIWKNELKGWGYGFVNMANTNAVNNINDSQNSQATTIALMTTTM